MSYLPQTRTLALLAFTFAAAGCTTIPSFTAADYVNPIDGARVVDNTTRYSDNLDCLRPKLVKSEGNSKRFAVGRVSDFTGKEDLTNGKRITQGASLMVMSALSRAGATLVERFDTSISDMELKYADNKLITDNPETQAYRKLMSGSLPGSDYHVVGGITEVNYNIRSGSVDSSIRFIALGSRYFVMNVAIDLRLVNTKTLEVVNNQSLQKQIIGTELSGGFFRIFSEGTVDIAASERTQEPIQRGVRMVVEQAVFNILNDTFGLNAGECRLDIPKPTVQASYAADGEYKLPVQKPTTPAQPQKLQPASVAPALPHTTQGSAVTVNPVRTQRNESTIELTTPGNESTGGNQKVLIDTATGEAYLPPLSETANKAAVEEEQGELNGLVGSGVSTETNSLNAKTTSSIYKNDDRMKEKLLWGTRPIIR